MRKLLTLALITLFASPLAFGQQRTYPLETNNWYFGNKAGIRFTPGSSGRPVSVTGATLLAADEGTTAISDTNGDLLFYVGTTGAATTLPSSVFNKNHAVMDNGNNITGGSSSTQNAIALRKPGSFTDYYIFSVAQVENYGTARGTGFYYSHVDMAANGGLGKVDPAEQNIQIVDSIAEKVSAVLHRNGRDLWVISHRYKTNEFVSVRLSSSGVSAPVITPVGIKHDYSRGAIKFSPNGNRVACAITESMGAGTSLGHYIQVGRFDNLTGEVYDLFHIRIPGATFTGTFGTYGVEFSPDNSKLYVGDRNTDKIYQFDLCAGDDSTSIIASKYEIPTRTGTGTATFEPGTLQLGLDGAIYISKVGAGTSIAAITAPNNAGVACGFQPTYVQLAAGTTCDRGLTNVNQSIFNDLAAQLEYKHLCERDTVTFLGNAACQGVTPDFFWHFGDPASGDDSVGTGDSVNHYYAKPGKYRVRLVSVVGNLVDTIYETITITALARGTVTFDSLACHQSYRFAFEQDTSDNRNVPITNYRWNMTGSNHHDVDSLYEGIDKPNIEILWDSNDVYKFALYLETTTSLGETCVSDSIPFKVNVNERRGATPIGPDTLCLGEPFNISSPDQPRKRYQWVYGPSSDPATLTGQGMQNITVLPTSPGNKTIRTAFYLDTLNQICYTESAPKRFYAAAPPADSIYVTGDSSICPLATPVTFTGTGRLATSSIHWRFQTENGSLIKFLSDTVGDTVRFNFDKMDLGRNRSFLLAQEVSKDGCRGPIRETEVWNACLITFATIVTQNDDQENQVFKVANIENFPNNELTVFNRWGKKVFNAKGYNNNSQMDLAPGLYFYSMRIFWEGRDVNYKGWFEVAKN